jgi:hypothetical protein
VCATRGRPRASQCATSPTLAQTRTGRRRRQPASLPACYGRINAYNAAASDFDTACNSLLAACEADTKSR